MDLINYFLELQQNTIKLQETLQFEEINHKLKTSTQVFTKENQQYQQNSYFFGSNQESIIIKKQQETYNEDTQLLNTVVRDQSVNWDNNWEHISESIKRNQKQPESQFSLNQTDLNINSYYSQSTVCQQPEIIECDGLYQNPSMSDSFIRNIQGDQVVSIPIQSIEKALKNAFFHDNQVKKQVQVIKKPEVVKQLEWYREQLERKQKLQQELQQKAIEIVQQSTLEQQQMSIQTCVLDE